MLNGWEIVLILLIVLILFGAKRLPELAKGLGQGIREFKKSTRDVQEEIHSAMDVNSSPTTPTPKRLPAETQVRTTDSHAQTLDSSNPTHSSPSDTSDSKPQV